MYNNHIHNVVKWTFNFYRISLCNLNHFLFFFVFAGFNRTESIFSCATSRRDSRTTAESWRQYRARWVSLNIPSRFGESKSLREPQKATSREVTKGGVTHTFKIKHFYDCLTVSIPNAVYDYSHKLFPLLLFWELSHLLCWPLIFHFVHLSHSLFSVSSVSHCFRDCAIPSVIGHVQLKALCARFHGSNPHEFAFFLHKNLFKIWN